MTVPPTEFKKSLEEPKLKLPQDKFWFVYLMFTFLGLINMLPLNFFVTCTNFWMYKFRNTTTNVVDAEHRTELQALTNAALYSVLNVSLPVFSSIVGLIGHKFEIGRRLIFGTGAAALCFVLMAIFVKVDTDNWQFTYFIMVMVTVFMTEAFVCISYISAFSIVGFFPKAYGDVYITAQGLAGLVTSILQLISLGLGMSNQSSALIYFAFGISILGIALLLILYSLTRSEFFQYYMTDYYKIPEKQDNLSLNQAKQIFAKIIPSFITVMLWAIVIIPTHTTITNLVVSEGEGSGSKWTDVYFVPTITYCLGMTADLVGRVIAPYIPIGFKTLNIFAFLRIGFIPLIMLCNAHPRSHLPIIFPHDYQYIIILVVFLISGGYVYSRANLNIPRLLEKSEQKKGYHLLVVSLGVALAVFSPLNFVSVKLL